MKVPEDGRPTAVILMGIPGSGKSTFAKQECAFAERINLDTLRTRAKEKRLLDDCLTRKKSFVIDNTNPRRSDRTGYILKAREAGYHVIGCFLCSSISECKDRNARREGKARVPDHVIAHIANILELPEYEEGFDMLYYVTIRNDSFVMEDWR